MGLKPYTIGNARFLLPLVLLPVGLFFVVKLLGPGRTPMGELAELSWFFVFAPIPIGISIGFLVWAIARALGRDLKVEW